MPSSIARQPETWKPPMPTGMPASRNGSRDIERARILVGSARRPARPCRNCRACGSGGSAWRHSTRVLVSSMRRCRSRRPGRARGARRSRREAIERRQRVGRNERPPPLDDVAVVVVVRRLDQHDLEATATHSIRTVGPISPIIRPLPDTSLFSPADSSPSGGYIAAV